ncbi:MAG TPA: hypothetical protein VLV18_10530 [Terriglobales bacterium]|nr:hypothetical protein [Terriglobales bacterium]
MPLKAPPETEHDCEATGVPEIEQDESDIEKPDPITWIVDPAEPLFGVNEIEIDSGDNADPGIGSRIKQANRHPMIAREHDSLKCSTPNIEPV